MLIIPAALTMLMSVTMASPPPPPPSLQFFFDAGFGNNMVLQRSPAMAAVYGYLEADATGVIVTVVDETTGVTYTVDAVLNITHQPFGAGFGSRPCSKSDCPPYDMMTFTPFDGPIPTWKAFLRPNAAGGNFTVLAQCVGCIHNKTAALSITNVTFGDVWFCSGQSNMWLQTLNTFSRNDTVNAILAGHYANIHLMDGSSGSVPYASWPANYGQASGSNPWRTAAQAVSADCVEKQSCPLFAVGASCWYTAQALVAQGVTVPIGLLDTAIGGQRIEEFMVNTSNSLYQCSNLSSQNIPWWNGQLYGQQILPFVDMTVKGWLWYQGENNMGSLKGNSAANAGYGCAMRQLIRGWREVWSQTPGTTDPEAPFGVATLASSGSEGGPNMGAMRWAQTANYGVLPSPELPNTFLAQVYDLDDEWGPAAGPCFPPLWACCEPGYNATTCAGREALCSPACAANADTKVVMSGIHPRSKRQVGARFGQAAFNTVYGGQGAFTGPTLSSCSVTATDTLLVNFNASLLRGDELVLQHIPAYLPPSRYSPLGTGGSQLWVQTNASLFCMEAQCVMNATSGQCANTNPVPGARPSYSEFCPTYMGGDGVTLHPLGTFDSGWILLNFTQAASGPAIVVDLSPLNGVPPTAIRYAWGIIDCCDHTDPSLYVTHGCIATCPIMSSSGLPANPFQAKIVNKACECVFPQVCS